MTPDNLKNYTDIIIPNLENKLSTETDKTALLELYGLYRECLRMVAHDDFISYNKYLELDEDKDNENAGFYYHRKNHLGDLFKALNDMEIHDAYDFLLVSMPPRVGKSVTNLRFISWILGRYPQNTQLAISYSDAITKTFYLGVLSILESQAFKDVFPEAKIVGQNAKDENIWLHNVGQYPTISFIPIEGSMTGRGQGTNYIFYDDLVSGIELALSRTRLDTLWGFYTTNSLQRRKQGCKEIHIATRWSVHDVLGRIEDLMEGNDRILVIKKPCFDENGESNFDYLGGFKTDHFRHIQKFMDELSFNALFMCQPIEREGLLYHSDELQYYLSLPETPPDAIIAVCDSKNLGKDHVASLILYIYGEFAYVVDLVYNAGLPDVTRPLVANMWLRHKVVRGDVELNNGGNYYAEDLDKMIRDSGGKTSIKIFYSGNNKNVKIISYADYVKKQFIFKDKSLYSSQSEYGKFMSDVFAWTQTGKNKFDDAPDVLAMGAQMLQDLSLTSVKILDRRTLGL